MWDQEKDHLAAFETMMPQYRVRPTALLPIWHLAGFALGAGSALIGGKEGAMAATVAVESVITEHYNDQVWVDEQKLHDFQKFLTTKTSLNLKKELEIASKQKYNMFSKYVRVVMIIQLFVYTLRIVFTKKENEQLKIKII